MSGLEPIINLDNGLDDILESQFDLELGHQTDSNKQLSSPFSDCAPTTMTRIVLASQSRSSSGSDEAAINRAISGKVSVDSVTQGKADSPDTDSAFCDDLSLLSSCSAASSNKMGIPSTVQSLTREELEATTTTSVELTIKVFMSDGSALSLLVDEKMTVGHVTRILAEKNHVSLDTKWALVELVPDLDMERVYEDNEMLVENYLHWEGDSKNTLWFIERPEKYDLFSRPEIYLLTNSSSQRGDHMEENLRQELLEVFFSKSSVEAPELKGNIWLKADEDDGENSWKKFFFVLRTSGLYYAPIEKNLKFLTSFHSNQVYYGIGWKAKYKAPTEYCFGIKHPNVQAKNPKYIKYLCVDSQEELHQWVTGIRVAKNGRHLFDNYRGIVEEITHADVDILTAKRFSMNSGAGLKMLPAPEKPQVLTPSSENKSLASALSSGIESDMSQGSAGSRPGAGELCGDQSVSGGSERTSVNGHNALIGNLEHGINSAFEASMSSLVEEEALPLPPPPRVASVTSLNTAEDIDLLPPPPPDMCLTEVSSHYLVSPVSGPGPALARLPPPAPAPKPGTQNKPSVVQSSSSVTLTDQGQESSSAPRLSAQFSRKLSLDERKYRYTHKYFLT